MKQNANPAALLILTSAILALWNVSGVWPLAVFALVFCLFTYRRLLLGRVAKLHRLWLYLAIVPFAIWFAAFPNTPGRFSPFFICIPAWYFLTLALLEWRSVGRGGRMVFVWFDAFVALILIQFEWNLFAVGCVAFASLVFLWNVRSLRNLKHWFLFVAVSSLIFAFATNVFLEVRAHSRSNWASRYENYYQERSLMGFSNIGKLGSFVRNYSGKSDRNVVFRIYSDRMPVYFKGVTYQKYIPQNGLWKQSTEHRFLQTGTFVGDYGGFEVADKADTVPVWVRSTLNIQNAIFMPPGAAGVAVKNVDSLGFYAGDFFQVSGNSPRDWYYWDGLRSKDALTLDSAWTLIPPPLLGLLDSAANAMQLSHSKDSVYSNLKKIRMYFRENFTYSLHLPLSKREDPLRTFYRERQGVCEYFASFATLLLRYTGTPARYAAGFAYPERVGDKKSGYWIFRRSHSHAWVEFLDSNRYWNTFDPTPMQYRPAEKADGKISQLTERVKSSLSLFWHELTEGRWRASLDSFGNWSANVLASTGFRIFLVCVLLALLGFLWLRRLQKHRREMNSVSERVRRLQKILKTAEAGLVDLGYFRVPGETVQKFSERIPNTPQTEPYRKMLVSYSNERWKSR